MGSVVGVSSSISAVSAVAGIAVAMGEGGVMGVRLLERLGCFFDGHLTFNRAKTLFPSYPHWG